jgi:hypothetical protein
MLAVPFAPRWLVLTLPLLFWAGGPDLGLRQGVRLELAVTPSITIGGPVMLRVTLVNDRSTPVPGCFAHSDQGPDQGPFTLDLTPPVGSSQRAWAFVSGVGPRMIPPKSKYGRRVALDEWLAFTTPGRYQLRVRFSGGLLPAVGIDDVKIEAERTFTVEVLPRDETRLLRRWRELEAVIGRERVGSEAYIAALDEMAYFRDPIAIPWLEAAMAREVFGAPFCESLARIGTPEARRALERLAKHSAAWVASDAKAALARVK